MFKSVLAFCAESVVNSKKERDLEIPYELPSLLGLDAFPPFLKTYMEEKEKEKDQNYHNRYHNFLVIIHDCLITLLLGSKVEKWKNLRVRKLNV